MKLSPIIYRAILLVTLPFILWGCSLVWNKAIVSTNTNSSKTSPHTSPLAPHPLPDQQKKKMAENSSPWKLYQNRQYGFTLKYPDSFGLYSTQHYGSVPNDPDASLGRLFSVTFIEDKYEQGGGMSLPALTSYVYDRKKFSSDDAFLQNQISVAGDGPGNPPLLERKSLSYGNSPAIKLVYGADRAFGDIYIFSTNNYIYSISWSAIPAYETIADRIYDQFTFIEPEPVTFPN